LVPQLAREVKAAFLAAGPISRRRSKRLAASALL